MSTILITGGAGFIGRHVAADLIAAGHSVRVLDSFIPQVHDGAEVCLPEEIEVISADIRDREALRRGLSGVDGVIHLAAEVGVGQSMYEISRYVGANDLGTAILLEAIYEHPVNRLVVASSMSVYGEGLYVDSRGNRHHTIRRSTADLRAGRWDPVGVDGETLEAQPTDEEKRPDLASIYALTKFAQEREALIFGETYGIGTVALRLFNVFGAGQALSNPYTGVLANFASRLAKGKRPTIFEDGRQRRDFVHVLDVARAFRLAYESDVSNEVINIGSGRSYSIAEVAELLAQAMGRSDLGPEILGKFRSGDIRNCFSDNTKAESLLGFRPEHRLEDSLDDLVAWVRDARFTDNGARMRNELEARGLVS